MQLVKAPDESPLDYHRRLVYGKLVDKTLGDIDYSEMSEYVYGQQYSSDVARRMMYGSKRTLELLDNERAESALEDASESLLSEVDSKMMDLKMERQKLSDQRTALNKILRGRSRQEELNELLLEAFMEGNLPELDYTPADIEPSDNDLLVSLTDIHYGIEINNNWNVYNPDIFKDMLCVYLDKIIEIGERHHSENCIVFANGDEISGNIHKTIQIANKENVVKQVMGVSELIAEFLAELSHHFKNVMFMSVAGNHSRIGKKDESPIDERLDDIVEWWLKARLQNFDNIIVGCQEKIDNTMYVMDIRGKSYVGVHGDDDIGFTKIAALQSMARREIYAVLCGHLHHNMVDEINGVKVVMAGSFVGMDDYCIQKRIYGQPEQMVCVCDKDGIVCHYDIKF